MKLGNRMAAIAAMVPEGSRIADIGTDHAYLPIHLVTEGIAPCAVAGEVHQGPYCSALDTVRRSGLCELISVRFGNGLAVLAPSEVDTVIIAGMGGANMIDILSVQPQVIKTVKRLVLQPMQASSAVRRWLVANGWKLADETLAKEDGRIYEIIVAEPGLSEDFDPVFFDIGPVLWNRRHPLLKEHLESLILQLKRIVASMTGSAQAATMAKLQAHQDKIALLEEKYICL